MSPAFVTLFSPRRTILPLGSLHRRDGLKCGESCRRRTGLEARQLRKACAKYLQTPFSEDTFATSSFQGFLLKYGNVCSRDNLQCACLCG